MKLYYLGPPGTFAQEAAFSFTERLGLANCEFVAEPTIAKVVERVHASYEQQEYALGCVPLENSIQGSVTMAWDTLGRLGRESTTGERPWQGGGSESGIGTSPTIVASLTLSIDQYLLGLPGTQLADVVEVLSHPQGLAQCTDWLHANLPQARQTAVASTADAARLVAQAGDLTRVAIGPRAAGRLYKLQDSVYPVQNSALNQTRFGLVALHAEVGVTLSLPTEAKWTLAMVLVGVDNAPGGLYRTLQPFHDQRFNLTRIESRPVGSKLGQYLFFIDVEWPYEFQQPDEIAAWSDVQGRLRQSGVQIVRLGLFPEIRSK